MAAIAFYTVDSALREKSIKGLLRRRWHSALVRCVLSVPCAVAGSQHGAAARPDDYVGGLIGFTRRWPKVVGGGGVGDTAIRYETLPLRNRRVMVVTVVALIVLVQVVPDAG